MLARLIVPLLLVGVVARVQGLEYFLDTAEDVTSEWQITCNPGYHENVDFDCGLGDGPLIPSIDHNSNTGFWARCGDGNGGIDCNIVFTPRGGSETLNRLGVTAYLQGGGRIEVGFEGDKPGTLYIEGNRWTSISNYIDISQHVPFRTLRLTMEFGSHFYFSVIDQVVVTDGGANPNTTTTTTAIPTLPPDTTTTAIPTLPPDTTTTTGIPTLPPDTTTTTGIPTLPPDTTTTTGIPTLPPDTTTTTGIPTLPPDTTTTTGIPTIPPVTTTTAIPTLPPDTTTTGLPPTTTPPPSSTARLCPHVTCGADGDYPDPQDCTGYVICSNGTPYCQRCPTGLYYDIPESQCDFPQNVDCGSRPIP